jgi:hypothetical protein
MPVSYRGNGEWEAHAWNSVKKLLSDMPLTAFPDAMVWIHNELKRVEPSFERLTGTFEVERMPLYKRLFRKSIEIKELRYVEKEFNGMVLKAKEVELIPRELVKE